VTGPAGVPGQRSTRQRTAVADVLDRVDGFRSAQELHALLRERGEGVGLATVYRTLQALADQDQVDVVRTRDGEAAYRSCSPVHHHHLMCRSCGRAVEVSDSPIERWASRIAAEHGFADVQHQLEVVGTCAGCLAAR
jgi:Fur family transcriptional regulator, ferric uptake regulator